MPRNGAGVYSRPVGTSAVGGTTISSADFNTLVSDLESDNNGARPIVAGGTGATNAASALVNLGITATAAELNALDGITATATELNTLDGITSTTAELNILDGVTATTAELNILDGVTATAAELNVLDGVTAFLDQDNMSSNSATAIPSQQSTKAYVDNKSIAPFAILRFEQPSGTGGGPTTSGSWRTYPIIDTPHYDPGGTITIASSQFSLNRNAYMDGWATLYFSFGCAIRLYNVTDATVTEYGENGRNDTGVSSNLKLSAFLTAGKTYRIEYRVASGNAQGFGTDNGFGGTNVYASFAFMRA